MKTIVIGSGDFGRRTKVAFLFVFLMLSMWACKAVGEEVPKVDQGRKSTEIEETEGPNFDCDKASTKVEITICDYKYLSDLDRQLNNVYMQKRAVPELRDGVRKEQLDWLRNERSTCESSEGMDNDHNDPKIVSCLRSAYLDRIREISSVSNDLSGGEVVAPRGDENERSSDTQETPIKFKLMKGSQYPLCRDYVENLNKYGYKDPPTCDRELTSDFQEFKEVDWVEIVNKEEIMKIKKEQVKMQYLWPPRNREKRERAWLSVEGRMDEGDYPILHVANIDMDHDGKRDKVYRFTTVHSDSTGEGRCSNRMSYFVKYDNAKKTESLYKRPSLYSTFLYFSGQVRLFYYEDRVRIDYWKGWSSQYHIVVSDIGESHLSQACGVNVIQ